MINNYKNKAIMVLSAIAILAFGAYAFADWGMGYGQGMHHRGWVNPGYGHMMGDLSEEQIRKLDKERKAFYEATEDLRQEIYGKELELRTELSRANPDAKKAASIQKEISKLEARLNQKQIDHMIAVKKINPNVGQGFMERGPRENGSYYRGSCWR
jgi:zinc resistance-associated protein